MDAYIYRPLPRAGQIKLIELEPENCSIDEVIQIAISSYNIEEVPQYEALSYAWVIAVE